MWWDGGSNEAGRGRDGGVGVTENGGLDDWVTRNCWTPNKNK